MKIWHLALMVAMLLPAGGCKAKPMSMNKRVGLTDGVVSVAVAVALDAVSEDKYEGAKADVIKLCGDLQAFLDKGNVSELPVIEVERALLKVLTDKGWASYESIVRALFDYVELIQVDVDKIGENNVTIIKLGLQEAIDAAKRSRMEWRPKKDPTTPVKESSVQ